MDKRIFLATWKDIPAANEVQYTIENVQHNAGMMKSFYFYIKCRRLRMRKPTIWVSNHVQHKPGCTAIEESQEVEISDLERGDIVLYFVQKQRC